MSDIGANAQDDGNATRVGFSPTFPGDMASARLLPISTCNHTIWLYSVQFQVQQLCGSRPYVHGQLAIFASSSASSTDFFLGFSSGASLEDASFEALLPSAPTTAFSSLEATVAALPAALASAVWFDGPAGIACSLLGLGGAAAL
eukprot:152548-Rhodomonas_salina.1